MELLEFEEQEENKAPIDIDDDDNYDDTDLYCEDVDKKDYNLYSSCDENPSAYLVQQCGHMIWTNCVLKTHCQLWGCRISNNKPIDLDNFEWYFHVLQCCNPVGAPVHFFQTFFTWLISVLS